MIKSLAVVVMFAATSSAEVKKPPPWKPAPEMAQLQPFVGTWGCEIIEDGKVVWKAKSVNAPEFGGAWISFRFDPDPVKGEAPDGSHGSIGWDSDQKKFVWIAVHGEGRWKVSTAGPVENSRLVLSPLLPQAADRRSIFVFKDPKHLELVRERLEGKEWKGAVVQRCVRLK